MEENSFCIANIGPKERQKRLIFGIVSLAVGVVIGLVLLSSDVTAWARIVLFLPFFGGGVGVFQSREKT